MKAFKDVSKYSGWKEFTTDHGTHVRAEDKGQNQWAIYIKRGDSYIHEANIFLGIKEKATCKKIWNEYCMQP